MNRKYAGPANRLWSILLEFSSESDLARPLSGLLRATALFLKSFSLGLAGRCD